MAQLGMASVYEKMKNIQKAQDAYQKAGKMAVASKQNYLLKNVYKGLSVIYSQKNDY